MKPRQSKLYLQGGGGGGRAGCPKITGAFKGAYGGYREYVRQIWGLGFPKVCGNLILGVPTIRTIVLGGSTEHWGPPI